jgi:hypothetical protein
MELLWWVLVWFVFSFVLYEITGLSKLGSYLLSLVITTIVILIGQLLSP